jgi:hypothetical protein
MGVPNCWCFICADWDYSWDRHLVWSVVMTKDYSDYETQRAILLEYMQVMIARGDWHGVSDAANDIRVLEAERNNNG